MNNVFRPFQNPNGNIPLVGQAFTVKGGFATTLIQCGCEAKSPILLIGHAPGVCPACRRGFVVADFSSNGQTGQIKTTIGLVRTELPTAPEPAGTPA